MIPFFLPWNSDPTNYNRQVFGLNGNYTFFFFFAFFARVSYGGGARCATSYTFANFDIDLLARATEAAK